MTVRTTETDVRTGSPWGGAVTAGIISAIVNLLVAWVIWMVMPPMEGLDLGWALTIVGITSFFAGLFSYYGAARSRY